MAEDIILTGPPRSGTTLTCHLLNLLDNTIALHEPMNLVMFPDRETALGNIASFFGEMRHSLLSEGKALSKVAGDKIPDNPFATQEGGHRSSIVVKKAITFDKPLSSDFRLIIKHNAHFSLLLTDLVKTYRCFSIIRHPLSVIRSWNTIQAPVAEGKITVFKTLAPEKYREIEAIPRLLDRQIRLLDYLFSCYVGLPGLTIIKYEDLIATQGSALESMVPEARRLNEPLQNRNRSPLYDPREEEVVRRAILDYPGAWESFYSRDSIAQL